MTFTTNKNLFAVVVAQEDRSQEAEDLLRDEEIKTACMDGVV